MITLQTAENALKEVYLGVIQDQLNNGSGYLFSRIKQTTTDVWGAEIRKIPSWQGNYKDNPILIQRITDMLASFEISDKAIRASQNSAGAFVNLLNSEIEDMVSKTQIETNKALFAKSDYFDFLGLEYLFNTEQNTLYGLDKSKYKELKAVCLEEKALTPYRLTEIIDNYNDEVNIIVCSKKILRDYKQYLMDHNQTIEILDFSGGYKGIDFNGIPIVSNRFIADNEMYLLNTEDFEFKQLCDWQWLVNESGKIITQVSGKPLYKATVVKYGVLICDNPSKQIKITLKPSEKAEI